jgi:hypothetical protein
MSISSFKKNKNNKIRIVNKKYNLYQYNLYIDNYVYIFKFATLSDITKYLENKDIAINLKKLLKNKLFKIELN